MTADHRRLAAEIVGALALETPPVALAFCASPPAGAAVPDAAVPSACAFWRTAERGLFYAPAARHRNCPVGAHVLGLPLDAAAMQELGELVGRMTACGYIGSDEAARIPTVPRASSGILYGPLADFPQPPDAVLLWLAPAQAMVWNEAAGGAAWTGPAPVFGRPACAAVPKALDGAPALSLGCIGMRTYTQVSQDRMLAVLPGARLQEFAAALARSAALNRFMQSFYEARAAAL